MSNCKYCFLCNNYKAYYLKLNYSFHKKPYGDCEVKHCMVNIRDTCPEWQQRVKKQSIAPIILKKLEMLTDDLGELIFIVKSNYDDE